jgi:hypothetical protein
LVLAGALAAKLTWEGLCVWRTDPGRVPERAGVPAPAGFARRGLRPVPPAGLARFLLGISAAFLALNAAGAGLALLAVLAGELIERARFFSAASWTGMPGPKT